MMAKQSKIIAWALLGIALTSCSGGGDSPNTSEAKSETKEESSSEVSSNKQYIEVSVSKNVIPVGTCFYDAAKPKVTYIDEDKSTESDVTDQSFRTTFKITDKNDSTKTYSAGDALPKGSYSAYVQYRSSKYSKTIDFTVQEQTIEKASEGKGYHTVDKSELSEYNYQNFSGIETLNGGGMPSTGEVNILVIPVQFKNEKARFTSNKDLTEEKVHDVLEEAFFAENENGEDTPWESLHSYYKKASFGALNIKGKVTSIVTYDADDTTLDSTNSSIAQTVTKNAISQLVESGEIDTADYDSNKDGYIDGVEVVYCTSQPTPASFSTDSSSGDLWWNFTCNVGSSANLKKPTVNRIFWSRFDYLTNTYYSSYTDESGNPIGARVGANAVDAHTIIHETGHMMGAPDYYSYDHKEGVAGCVDMMDMNIGDHNAYTKMAYNWVGPMVIDGTSNNFEITLPSYTDTGKFLLVRNTTTDVWNKTPYDEYLIIEYYTPTGVNKMDSTGYPEWSTSVSTTGSPTYGHGGTYKKEGLQVFHVDARAGSTTGKVNSKGKIPSSGGAFAYTDTPKSKNTINDDGTYETSATLYASNDGTSSGRMSAEIVDGELSSPTSLRHLKAITPSGVDSFAGSSYYSGMGNMANLFGLDSYWGDQTAQSSDEKYGGSSYSNYKMRSLYMNDLTFNDGSYFNWNFEIAAQSEDSITLHFINVA